MRLGAKVHTLGEKQEKWEALPKVEQSFREALAECSGYSEATNPDREICITPYEGNYGHAGFAICVNGSPPRGTVIVPCSEYHRVEEVVVIAFRVSRIRKDSFRKGNKQKLLVATEKLLAQRGFLK